MSNIPAYELFDDLSRCYDEAVAMVHDLYGESYGRTAEIIEEWLLKNSSWFFVRWNGGYNCNSGGDCQTYRFDKSSKFMQRGNLPQWTDEHNITRLPEYVLVSTTDLETPEYPYQEWIVGYYTKDGDCFVSKTMKGDIKDVLNTLNPV